MLKSKILNNSFLVPDSRVEQDNFSCKKIFSMLICTNVTLLDELLLIINTKHCFSWKD